MEKLTETQRLARRLKSTRKQHGWTQTHVAKLVGVSKQTVSQWEKGRTPPRMGNLEKFCAAAGVSLSSMVSKNPAPVDAFPQMAAPVNAGTRIVPLYSLEAISGRLTTTPNNQHDGGWVSTNFQHASEAFSMKVADRAMTPNLQVGDLIVIDPILPPEPGTLVLAQVRGDIVTRKYRPRSATPLNAELHATNPDWPILIMAEGDEIKGVIVELIRLGPLVA